MCTNHAFLCVCPCPWRVLWCGFWSCLGLVVGLGPLDRNGLWLPFCLIFCDVFSPGLELNSRQSTCANQSHSRLRITVHHFKNCHFLMICRKRAEYGFGEYGFKHRAQWFVLPSPSSAGENSVSSSQPTICVPKRTHQVFGRTHRVCPKTQWVLFSETVLSKQYSARFLIWPTEAHCLEHRKWQFLSKPKVAIQGPRSIQSHEAEFPWECFIDGAFHTCWGQ